MILLVAFVRILCNRPSMASSALSRPSELSSPPVLVEQDETWTTEVHLRCSPSLRDELWPLYRDSFTPLAERAAQRHLFSRDEIDDLLRDERLDKVVVRSRGDAGTVAALGVITNDLDAVPLVSPDYYRHRWPEHFERRRIWYVALTAVHPRFQGTRAVGRIIKYLCDLGGAEGGIFAADICEFNERELRFPTAIGVLGRTFNPGIRDLRLDAQVYWAYEVPAPQQTPVVPGAPTRTPTP